MVQVTPSSPCPEFTPRVPLHIVKLFCILLFAHYKGNAGLLVYEIRTLSQDSYLMHRAPSTSLQRCSLSPNAWHQLCWILDHVTTLRHATRLSLSPTLCQVKITCILLVKRFSGYQLVWVWGGFNCESEWPSVRVKFLNLETISTLLTDFLSLEMLCCSCREGHQISGIDSIEPALVLITSFSITRILFTLVNNIQQGTSGPLW